MTDIGFVQKTRAQRNDLTQGSFKRASLNRFGNLTVAMEGMSAVDEGNVFVANRGTAATAISFNNTTYDANQPQLVIDVPSGITIVPLYLEVVMQDQAGTDNVITWSTSDAILGAGTSTAVTPANMKINAAGTDASSQVNVYRDYTGDSEAAPSNGYEFARSVDAFVQEAGSTGGGLGQGKAFVWSRQQMGFGPVIEGTGALILHTAATSTAQGGYATAIWYEYAT